MRVWVQVLIVGINSKDGKAGEISRYSGEEMMALGSTRATANEVELTMMLEICSFHQDMREVELVTIIPQNIIDVHNGLSDTMLESMPKLLEETLNALKDEGIILQKKDTTLSFGEIIHQVANPKAQRPF